jgi:hypothetical protein
MRAPYQSPAGPNPPRKPGSAKRGKALHGSEFRQPSPNAELGMGSGITAARKLAAGATAGAVVMVMEIQGVPSGPISTGSWTVARSPGASAGIEDHRASARWSFGATRITEAGADSVPRFTITSVTTSNVSPGVSDGSRADTTASEYSPRWRAERAEVATPAWGVDRRTFRWAPASAGAMSAAAIAPTHTDEWKVRIRYQKVSSFQ